MKMMARGVFLQKVDLRVDDVSEVYRSLEKSECECETVDALDASFVVWYAVCGGVTTYVECQSEKRRYGDSRSEDGNAVDEASDEHEWEVFDLN